MWSIRKKYFKYKFKKNDHIQLSCKEHDDLWDGTVRVEGKKQTEKDN